MTRTTIIKSAPLVLAALIPLCGHQRLYNTTSTNNLNQTSITRKMQKSVVSETLKRCKEETLWGMFIADAVAMPVHWYYNPDDIKHGYNGWLTGYNAPNKQHPTSILTISNSGGSGRANWGKKTEEVIGNVILHDKLKYWTSKDRTIHYHQGMKAGDNTLNPTMALQILKTMNKVDRTVTKSDSEVREAVMEDYVKFMTTPDSHNDTYCESFHRAFFKDWISSDKSPPTTGKEIVQFAEDRLKTYAKQHEDHQLLAIGALIPAIPWIVRTVHLPEKECVKSAVEFLKLTHPVPSLYPLVEIYARLLHSVMNGKDLRTQILKVAEDPLLGGSRFKKQLLAYSDLAQTKTEGSEERLEVYQKAISNLGMACYIDGAMKSMLFLAYEFHDDFEGGILANANCGGENCHRGGALGALLGAASTYNNRLIPEKWKEDLGVNRLPLKSALAEMNQC